MYHLVVDLGGTRVRVALVRADFRRADGSLVRPDLIARREERTEFARGGAEATIEQLLRMISDTLGAAGIDNGQVDCIGVAAPGPLDPGTGVIISPPNLHGWRTVPLREELQKQTGIRTSIRNDADAAALAEYHFGAGKARGVLVYFTVSTGVGGGIVINGRLLEGTAPGELGHMTVDRHGPSCKCGSIGCLEAIASGTSIAKHFQEALDAGAATRAETKGRQATAADIAEAARTGDDLAQRIWSDAMEALGFGVLTAINVFDPNVVVLGGGVTTAGELLFEPVRAIVKRHGNLVAGRHVPIVPAELGEDVGLLGAAIIADECAQETAKSGVI
jgi:glucokinase